MLDKRKSLSQVERLSMNLCPWCYQLLFFQPIIDPHDDKGEKQDNSLSYILSKICRKFELLPDIYLEIMTLNIK